MPRCFVRLTSFAACAILISAWPALAETFGDGTSLEEVTPIATVLEDPDAWRGKEVRVVGMVNDVCPRKGCWMSLREGDAVIRIKVEDDVIRFPMAAKDHRATAEGVVEVLDLDRERYAAWLAHLAEEKGQPFDPASVGDPPYRLVQIQGQGAEIDL